MTESEGQGEGEKVGSEARIWSSKMLTTIKLESRHGEKSIKKKKRQRAKACGDIAQGTRREG